MDPERDRRPGSDPPLTPTPATAAARTAAPHTAAPHTERRAGVRARARRRFRPPRKLRATRAGWCFIAIIFGVGFAALNTGNNLLYLVLALMLAFLVLSGLLSEASLRGIRVERLLPRELFACGPNRVVLRVHNAQKRVASFAISLADHVESPTGSRAVGRSFALRVGPRERSDRSYVFEPARRGDLHFERILVSTRFPFGLFVKSVELDAEADALVFPPIHPITIESRDTRSGLDPEERVGLTKRGDDVAGLREFVPGDGVGRVHWKRSLRLGRLLVGEREGEASGEIEVWLPLSRGDSEAASERAIARAASEIVAYLDAGLRVGLRSASTRFAPSTGRAHRNELLTYLARVTPESLERPTAEPSKTASPTLHAAAPARAETVRAAEASG